MKLKKIILILTATCMIVGMCVLLFKTGKKQNQTNKISIVSSNFACYDFLRAIIGQNEEIELTFLLGPGKDAHSYDPTAQDLVKIQNASLFVYIGGETEKWVDKVLESMEKNDTKNMCITDFVQTIEEKEIDGAEEEEEEEEEIGSFDDHIWTSPSNAVIMVNALEERIAKLDKKNENIYRKNADDYISKINEVDNEIREIVNNKVRDRLIFGDRMPMQYFIDYYDLKVSAAFSGCSTETEPSAKTISYLESKVKEDKIPVVFYIELNNGRVAQTIAKEAGNNCEALQIQTLHNISLDDFNNGETWVTLMKRNIEPLKKALD